MPKSFNAPSATNPAAAGWLNKFVQRSGNDIVLHDDPTVRHLGIVVSADDRLGGAVGVALPGELARLEIGTTIDVSTTDLITTDASAEGQPAAAPNIAMAVLAQQTDATAGTVVDVRVLDGLTVLS